MTRKINIFADREYIATTTQAESCKAAKIRIQQAADTYGTVDVAGRGRVDILGKKITARYAE